MKESQKAEENVQVVKDKIEQKMADIAAGEEEVQNIEKECDEIARKRDAVS